MDRNPLIISDIADPSMVSASRACRIQQQQAWLRIVLGILFYLYIAFHGPFFYLYGVMTAGLVGTYIAINLLAILWHIRKYPRSRVRLFTMPVIDCLLISMAMFNDGGQASPIFFLFLSVILGNGLRYGQQMLIYTQALSVLSLAVLAALTPWLLHTPDDWLVLALEILGLLYISTYAKIIIQRAKSAIEEKRSAELASSRLLIDIPTPAFTFESSPEGIRIVQANPAMAKISSIPFDGLAGMMCKSLCIQEDVDVLEHACLDALAHADEEDWHPKRTYVRAPAGDRHTIQLMCDATTTRITGRILGVCFISDITESDRYHLELQEAQMQGYVAALASGLAHDFRNVLASIMGEAEVMQMNCSDDRIREGLEMIIRASERGSSMTTHLLQLGKGSGKMQRKIDLTEGLEATVKLARVRLPASIQLDCKIDMKLPSIFGDTAQIEQVLLNLINNAAQAIRQSGNIHVEAFPDASHILAKPDKPALCIRVSDDGVGIAEENLQRIFDAFWTTRKEVGGTGLGLSMVRRIVRWHKGDIDVSSTTGKGTRFSLYFPPAEEKSPTSTGEHLSASESDKLHNVRHKPWQILLVEDAPDVMRVHEALLTRMGHKVLTAVNGKEALALLQKVRWQVDFILSDYRMPEVDGLQMVQQIRSMGKSLPITIITAYGEDEALQQAAGLDTQLLFKPVKFNVLASHIAEIQREMTTS